METGNTQGSSLAIPIAIVVAAALVAGAIFLGGGSEDPDRANNNQNGSNEELAVRPVDDTDHIRGNPNAQIMLIEYSDYDCPFCKQFHETMNRVMNEYGTDGQVAWVYRHFPLVQLHPNAPRIAEAAECAAELGGNEAFWAFSDLVFEERGTNEQTNLSQLPDFAIAAGVEVGAFESCLDSGRYTDAIQEDVQEALAAGGRGTPHTIVIVGDQQGVINGAQPYEVVSQIIDNLLGQIGGGNTES